MNINLTLFGQMVAFAVFVYFCMRYVWPPLTTALQERQKKIADGLAAADRASKDLELAQEKATQELRDAKTQAAEIIEQAKKRADAMVEDAKSHAVEEGDRLKAAAASEIEQERNRAREALRAELAGLVVLGAEKVLGSSVDQSAHQAMLDQLATEL